MGTARADAAAARRTYVGLNLPDLEGILSSLISSATSSREARRDPLIRRIQRARDRRLKAVERAMDK